MADQLAAPLLKMHNPDSQIKTPNLDEPQLFNLARDPLELHNLARTIAGKGEPAAEPWTPEEEEARAKFAEFEAEARERWDFDAITKGVLHSQRKRRLVWLALKKGRFTSWDYNPVDDGTTKYGTVSFASFERDGTAGLTERQVHPVTYTPR